MKMLVQIWDLGSVGMPLQAPVVAASYPFKFDVPAPVLVEVKSAVSILDDTRLRIAIAYPQSVSPIQAR